MKKLALLLLLCSTFAFGQGAPNWTTNPGNLTGSGSACNNTDCVAVTLGLNASSAAVILTGTFSATVQFEESADGQNFVSANAFPQPTATAAVTSATSTGTWVVPVAGMAVVRVRVSSYASGTVSAYIFVGNGTFEPTNSTSTGTVNLGNGGNGCQNPSSTLQAITVSTSGTSATQFIAASGSTKIYVCSVNIGNGGGTTPTLSLQYGTGANCVTSPTTFQPLVAVPAGTAAPVLLPGPQVYVTPASQALCYTMGGTTPTGTLVVTYVQQ